MSQPMISKTFKITQNCRKIVVIKSEIEYLLKTFKWDIILQRNIKDKIMVIYCILMRLNLNYIPVETII